MTAFAGRFEDRVAVVTGGAQGIGLAVAQRLVAEGARVVIWDSNAEANESGLVALAASVMATSATLDIVDEGAASGGCGRGHIRPHRCARSFSRDSRP